MVPEGSDRGGAARDTPSSAAVSFVTTEHFTLQSARAQTIAESTSRASMYLGAVSAGLVALGLIATATRIGTAFYAFALVVLPTLALVGLATFERTLQSGIEDYGYARRIARLRAYYFDHAPELAEYLASVPAARRLELLGLWSGRFQSLRTVAGTVADVVAVIAGSAVGLAAALVTSHSIVVGFATGIVATAVTFLTLVAREQTTWRLAAAEIVDGESAA
jgi:hypothetical protein